MLVPIIVVAVLALLLIFFLVKSAANWNWVQITFTALIFITAIFGAIAASRALKTRHAWMGQSENNEQAVLTQQQQFEAALYGPSDAIEYDPASLRGINHRLQMAQLGTGRVWLSGRPEINNDQLQVTFSAGDGVSAAPQFVQDMVLYGFADAGAQVEDQTVTVPVNYIGTFKVVSSAGDVVTFTPIFVPQRAQGEVSQPTTTWSFFERMPGDARNIFLSSTGMSPDNVDMSAYREALKTQFLPADRLGFDLSDPDAAAAYERLLDEYTFDGQPLNDIRTWVEQQADRVNDRFDPAPAQQKLLVKMNQEVEFTVDASGSLISEGQFNNNGQAVDKSLQIGEPVKISKDQEMWVDRPSADGYALSDTDRQPGLLETADGSVVNEFYVRPLRDYPFLLEEVEDQTRVLARSRARVDANTKDTENVITNARSQIGYRDDEISKLQDDIGRLQKDYEAVTALLDERQKQYDEKQVRIRTYYNQILKLYQELQQRQGEQGASSGAPALAAQ